MTAHLQHCRITLRYVYSTKNRTIHYGNNIATVSDETYRNIEYMAYTDGHEMSCKDNRWESETIYAITEKQYALFALMLKAS